MQNISVRFKNIEKEFISLTQLNSKAMAVGRPRNVESPKRMWYLFQDYCMDLDIKAADWVKIQYVGKDAVRKSDNYKLPLTFEGFKRFCWDEEVGDVEAYFLNDSRDYPEFSSICARIKTAIRENQVMGGMLGVYNPSITQRLNGLVEKQETKIDQDISINFED